MHARWIPLALTIVVIAGCESSGGVESVDVEPTSADTVGEGEAAADEAMTGTTSGTTTDDAEPTGSTDVLIEEILAELEANGFCDPDDVEGTGDIGITTAMHFVIEAQPAPPCFGAPDDRLDQAWADLADIAPVDYLDDISLLAGYEACEGCDTLAFVSPLDDAGTFFLMAIDVTAAQDDPDELSLTLLHELSHVFTQDPVTQLDVEAPPSGCTTYHNGNGCLRESSYLWSWMIRFWEPDALAGPDEAEADQEAGEERCELGGDFTGSYGASSPEEDFAEVFAAYVFDIDFEGQLDEKLAFFDDIVEFRRIRDRAEALELTGLANTFERCG